MRALLAVILASYRVGQRGSALEAGTDLGSPLDHVRLHPSQQQIAAMAPSQLHGPRRTVTQWLALYCLLFATLVVAAGTPAPPPRHGSDTIREAGRCSLGQTTCGQKGGVFGEPLPCVSNELAVPLADDPSLAASLLQVCGPEVAVSWTSVCCNQGSLDRLSQSLQQAQAFIALCPACSRSFTSYYCHFTCSPDQSTFVTVSDVQDLGDAKGPAVKSLELHVDQDFGESFYDACANVKFAATNGLAMDFIGGGAKDWKAFLRYMGQEVRHPPLTARGIPIC